MNTTAQDITARECYDKPGYPTLKDMSEQYAAEAKVISEKLKPLRAALRECADSQERLRLKSKIYSLTTILTQTRELAELTANYYVPGYWRKEIYCVQIPRKKKNNEVQPEDDFDALLFGDEG